jgi:hypothetical protein
VISLGIHLLGLLLFYAHRNGQENRDKNFQSALEAIIQTLIKMKRIDGIHFQGKMKWK